MSFFSHLQLSMDLWFSVVVSPTCAHWPLPTAASASNSLVSPFHSDSFIFLPKNDFLPVPSVPTNRTWPVVNTPVRLSKGYLLSPSLPLLKYQNPLAFPRFIDVWLFPPFPASLRPFFSLTPGIFAAQLEHALPRTCKRT